MVLEISIEHMEQHSKRHKKSGNHLKSVFKQPSFCYLQIYIYFSIN